MLFIAAGCDGAKKRSASGETFTSEAEEVFVRNPAAYGNHVMPPFGALGAARLRQLGLFLEIGRASCRERV